MHSLVTLIPFFTVLFVKSTPLVILVLLLSTAAFFFYLWSSLPSLWQPLSMLVLNRLYNATTNSFLLYFIPLAVDGFSFYISVPAALKFVAQNQFRFFFLFLRENVLCTTGPIHSFSFNLRRATRGTITTTRNQLPASPWNFTYTFQTSWRFRHVFSAPIRWNPSSLARIFLWVDAAYHHKILENQYIYLQSSLHSHSYCHVHRLSLRLHTLRYNSPLLHWRLPPGCSSAY
jgi:hypothetical protein